MFRRPHEPLNPHREAVKRAVAFLALPPYYGLAFRLLYRSGVAPASAVKRVRAELGHHPLVAHLVEFVETAKRGVVPGPGRGGHDRAEAVEEGIS